MNKDYYTIMNQSKDYNSRLKPLIDKGICGDPEIFDSIKELSKKIKKLVDLIKTKDYIVIFTGAGISTSSGIPDFRGPNGVWTKELQGCCINNDNYDKINTFSNAKPSYTHYSISCLIYLGIFKHIISQNVDGLHLRSGIVEKNLSELHGNIFKEKCDICKYEYFRNYDVGGMGLNLTGRTCDQIININNNDNNNNKDNNNNTITDNVTKVLCNGLLRDCAIDWDTELPELIFKKANQEMKQADLVICLGTSLRIYPAGNIPLQVLKPNKIRKNIIGDLVIVNLQKTNLDKKCSLKINYYCDYIMKSLCDQLGIQIHIPNNDDNSNTTTIIDNDRFTIETDSIIDNKIKLIQKISNSTSVLGKKRKLKYW